jgi:hypothetical protein
LASRFPSLTRTRQDSSNPKTRSKRPKRSSRVASDECGDYADDRHDSMNSATLKAMSTFPHRVGKTTSGWAQVLTLQGLASRLGKSQALRFFSDMRRVITPYLRACQHKQLKSLSRVLARHSNTGLWWICFEHGSVVDMRHLPKTRPRTKHLFVRLPYFRYHELNERISVQRVQSEDQLTDSAPKPKPASLFIAQSDILLQ